MTISASPVQEKASDAWTAGTSFTISGFTAPVNGNCLVLYFDSGTAAQGISSITQTGATWVLLGLSNTVRRVEIWYALNVSGAGTTITLNLNYTPVAANSQSASLSEWSGIATVSAADATGANTGSAVTTDATATITPTAGREALLIAGLRSGGAVSSGPTNSFTALLSSDAAGRGYGAYRVVNPTSGSYSTAWTAGSSNYDAMIGTLLAPLSGVKPPPAALFQFTHR